VIEVAQIRSLSRTILISEIVLCADAWEKFRVRCTCPVTETTHEEITMEYQTINLSQKKYSKRFHSIRTHNCSTSLQKPKPSMKVTGG
jgi:hypothetical protein